MTNNLKLNYTKAEYRDDYSDSDGEFWQCEAQESLINKLIITLREAKEYKKSRNEYNKKTWLSHNAILVSGQRGTGKTVFLRNCEKLWRLDCKNNDDLNSEELIFLSVIDPTMLVNNDNFSNVIIAQIYYVVEQKIRNSSEINGVGSVTEKAKANFYNSLKKLADALGKKDDFNGHSGIDKILQYNSGIQIESYFHLFIESAINLLGCQALVLPIDDVDMALGRAFEVVDDVRRLLGCPYIIPIVSGDMRLYEQMTNVHFDKNAYDNESKNEDLISEGILISKELTTSYLTKVFPNQMRIGLRPIANIIPSLSIIPHFSDSGLRIADYYDLIFNRFYFLCSNEEVLNNWPSPESARELTQLVRSINPEILSNKSDNIIWGTFQNWAEQKKNGVAFTNAMSWFTFNDLDVETSFNIENVIAFNPKLQMTREQYPWANKDFLGSQKDALNSMFSQPKQASAQLTSNLFILNSAYNEDNYTLRSMPPYEFFDDKKYVTQEVIKATNTSMLEDSNSNVLLDIYTHGDYYSTLSVTYQYVFCSRAFELILFSFVNKSLDIEKDIYNILGRRPFYSIFNANPTKVIQDDSLEEDLEKTDDSKRSSADILAGKINDWKKNHKDFFDEINSSDLISIFSFMFNKTFSALHLYKSKKNYTDEHLTDLARRFELILVNSAMTASIKGNAINANVAQTDNYKTLRDYNEFIKYDRTITRNHEKLKDENISNEFCLRFIDVLWDHPIFEINKCRNVLENLYSLGKSESDDKAASNESKLSRLRDELKLENLQRVNYIYNRLIKLDESNKKKLDKFIQDSKVTNNTKLDSSNKLDLALFNAIKKYLESINDKG
ncbi:antiviral RADAR system adenosine triphosphatase RdrA [Photobacterium andalusiense]|uniref:Uncharacterized protein n=1 Tax=Photobacterium andalusiense TaxID=2204296 RepID=A0A1Y6MG92_9GAMM|nr:antiviral RADAR system adenosine triphosphatase RdrA [Photobacterium andalusiense]SMY34929.1 hypothetical protein PAND9192_01597 [Photobacterium andalusiense]